MKLTDLVKPRWQHSEADVRKSAIEEGNLDAATLELMARSDTNADVRTSAITLVDAEAVLIELLQATAPDATAATRRLANLCGGVADAVRVGAVIPPALMQDFIQTLTTPEHQLALVSAQSDLDVVESFLGFSIPAAVASACVDAIDEKSRLLRIQACYAGKNKTIIRRTEEKLATIAAEEQREAAFHATCREMVTEAEALAATAWDEHLKALHDLLVKRWETTTADAGYTVEAESQARFDPALASLRAMITEMPLRIAAACESADAIIEALASRYTQQQSEEASWSDLASFCTTRQFAWQALERDLIDDTRRERFNEELKVLQNLTTRYEALLGLRPAAKRKDLRRQITIIAWPDGISEPPALQLMRTQLQEMDARAEAVEKEAADAEAAFVAAVEKLEQLLDAGDLEAARTAEKQDFSNDTHDKSELNKQQRARLGKARKRLTDLRDWEGFATLPKRQALCEQMELLAAAECTAPAERAVAVRALQTQWKALGRSDSPAEQKLWRRFHTVAEAAYAPCKEHFVNLDGQRQQNLDDAESICTQLESFVEGNNWDAPDWPGVRKILQSSRTAFRQLADLPRRAIKPTRDRFNKVVQSLSDKLGKEEQANAAQKQGLIDEIAERLTASAGDDVEALISLAKRAQQQWRAIGITRYKEDKQLWADFRARCDAVFALRDTARQAQRSEEDKQTEAAAHICEDIDTLLLGDQVDRGEFSRLRTAFRSIQLPRDERKLKRRFDAQCRQFELLLAEEASARVEMEMQSLRDCAAACVTLEAGEAGIEVDLSGLGPALQKRMEARVKNAQAGAGDAATNADTAETLCVRAEMVAGVASPPESTQRRLQLQVDTLNNKFSTGTVDNRSPADKFRELQIDWYCLGPLPADIRQRLSERFVRAEHAMAS